jgi:threonine dehydrogenase-like Zn-dependent dehydrogenase
MTSVLAATLVGPRQLEVRSYPYPDELEPGAVLCGRNLTLMGIGGEDLLAYEGTLALLARHHRTIPFADMVSHRCGVEDVPEAMRTALDADGSAKVLITAG